MLDRFVTEFGPCRPAADSVYSGVLEAAGPAAEQWLLSPAFEERLFSYFPCADPPAAAGSPVVRHQLITVQCGWEPMQGCP